MLGGGMRFWTNCFFSCNTLFLPEKKAKDVKVIQRTRIHRDLSYIDPRARVLNYFWVKVINAIIINEM